MNWHALTSFRVSVSFLNCRIYQQWERTCDMNICHSSVKLKRKRKRNVGCCGDLRAPAVRDKNYCSHSFCMHRWHRLTRERQKDRGKSSLTGIWIENIKHSHSHLHFIRTGTRKMFQHSQITNAHRLIIIVHNSRTTKDANTKSVNVYSVLFTQKPLQSKQ